MNQIKTQHRALVLGQWIVLLAAISSDGLAQAGTGTLPPPTSTQYQFTTIDIPDQQFMAPFAPNNSGNACGSYIDNAGLGHGFLWRAGVVTTLDAHGAPQTVATGINDHGLVSGSFGDMTAGRAFLYSLQDGSWTLLAEIPGASLAGLPNVVVNNRGIVAGGATLADGSPVSWIWNGKAYSMFSPPGSVGGGPLGINDRNQIAGIYIDQLGTMHGFLKDGPTLSTIDVPGADWTAVFSINNEGDVAGTYFVFDPVFEEQGFILRKGQFTTVPVPGYGGMTGINDRGDLGGTYQDSVGVWHGFIATALGNSTTKP